MTAALYGSTSSLLPTPSVSVALLYLTALLDAVRTMTSVEQLTALEAVALAVRERAVPLLEQLRDTAPEDMT